MSMQAITELIIYMGVKSAVQEPERLRCAYDMSSRLPVDNEVRKHKRILFL